LLTAVGTDDVVWKGGLEGGRSYRSRAESVEVMWNGLVGDGRRAGAVDRPSDFESFWKVDRPSSLRAECIVVSYSPSSRARSARAAAARLPIDLDASRDGVPALRSEDGARLAAEKAGLVGVLRSKTHDSRERGTLDPFGRLEGKTTIALVRCWTLCAEIYEGLTCAPRAAWARTTSSARDCQWPWAQRCPGSP
jgi:hypothetical protein